MEGVYEKYRVVHQIVNLLGNLLKWPTLKNKRENDIFQRKLLKDPPVLKITI